MFLCVQIPVQPTLNCLLLFVFRGICVQRHVSPRGTNVFLFVFRHLPDLKRLRPVFLFEFRGLSDLAASRINVFLFVFRGLSDLGLMCFCLCSEACLTWSWRAC